MQKYCTKCLEYKFLDKYHKHKNGKFGRHSKCKNCRKNCIKKTSQIVIRKKCNQCNIILNSSNFYKNKNNTTGLSPSCKTCYLERRSKNQSKIENYMKIILKKFKRKHTVDLDVLQLIRMYHSQNEKCFISSNKMTHIVDVKGRTDNIWNISIIPINNNKILEISDVKLCINLFYSVKKKYKLNTTDILDIYHKLSD